MHAVLFAASLVMVTAMPTFAQDYDECRHEAQRTANVDANGARLLALEAGAGSLKIEGKPGLNRVVIRGRACASHADLLDDIKLQANREGTDVVVEANKRNHEWDTHRRDEYARLDLIIEIPARMAAEIIDGSGTMELSNLGTVRITDGSGDIIGDDLNGDVRVRDGSGSIRLTDVAGRVNIDDGSGGISLRNISGPIDVNDSSGEITIRVAQNNVRISDSSGGIDVSDVAGDFVVVDDSSGEIDYDNVKGTVDIPRKRRR
jgi:hypothetical protein